MPSAATVTTPLLITRFDAAALSGVAIATWDRLVASGRTPRPVKVGGSVRFVRRDIERWALAGCPSRSEFEAMEPA